MQPSSYLPSPNFGIPAATVGRNGQTIKALVIHCVSGLLEADGNSTLNQTTEIIQQPHNSYHYAVGTDGIVHQYVVDSNTAWGFQNYGAAANPAPSSTLNGSTWALIGANVGIQPDLYSLHVAIPCPSRNTPLRYDACGNPTCTLSDAALRSSSQLLKDLLDLYGLTTADMYLHSVVDTRYADETAACFSFAALQAAVAAVTALPPALTLACQVGQSIPNGVFVQGIGLDATGCLVKGAAPGVIADNQVLASADGSLTFTPAAAVGPDNQVNYDLSVNWALSPDFWRSGAHLAAVKPDGTTDTTDQIEHVGGATVGSGASTTEASASIGTGVLNAVAPTQLTTTAIATPETALRLFSSGAVGVKFNPSADLKIGTYAAGLSASTKTTLSLGNGNVHVPDADVMTWQADGKVGIGITAPVAALDISGATVNRPAVIANIAANGQLSTAAATVDIASIIQLAQTTAAIVLTLPAPTNAQAGRLLTVVNTGTVSTTVDGQTVPAGKGQAFEWDGAVWRPVGSSGGGKGYRQTSTFVAATNLVVTHNLGLADPFLMIYQLRDAAGNIVNAKIVSATANSITLVSPIAMATIDTIVLGA